MTKSEVVKRLSRRYPGIYQKDLQKVVDLIFDEIGKALIEERRVEIRGFGAFTVRKREPRKARNPRTGAVVSLGTRYSPYFRAGKELRDRINGTPPVAGATA